jgi:serine/threonine protein kinase
MVGSICGTLAEQHKNSSRKEDQNESNNVLEWIEGQTLQNSQENETIFPFAEQVRILHALASALEACHSKGILHRNLTPASVYLAENGIVQVGDFDFAQVPSMTQTISITGKPLITKSFH